jgi:hypothetical protein
MHPHLRPDSAAKASDARCDGAHVPVIAAAPAGAGSSNHERMKFRIIALALIVLGFLMRADAKDAYPGGCVDCHAKEKRVSAQLSHWNGKVDAKTLAAMQAFVPKGMTLRGKHPTVATKDIPASCMKCHTATSKGIPPLAPLMHGIHLAKADAVECTNCHKLNRANGTWSLPSGAEK